MPRFTVSSNVSRSGGTETRSAGMTSPSLSGGDSRRGSNVTYCSPTADWLCTWASTSEGMSTPELSESTAATPVSVSRTLSTLPTSVPR
ncbi:hypothetical protein LAUMK40_01924 [Mycobacterium kansasii]|nr:hypothetical protein LAUMK40_01924 [Mycobacterium kansasii]